MFVVGGAELIFSLIGWCTSTTATRSLLLVGVLPRVRIVNCPVFGVLHLTLLIQVMAPLLALISSLHLLTSLLASLVVSPLVIKVLVWSSLLTLRSLASTHALIWFFAAFLFVRATFTPEKLLVAGIFIVAEPLPLGDIIFRLSAVVLLASRCPFSLLDLQLVAALLTQQTLNKLVLYLHKLLLALKLLLHKQCLML